MDISYYWVKARVGDGEWEPAKRCELRDIRAGHPNVVYWYTTEDEVGALEEEFVVVYEIGPKLEPPKEDKR